MCTTPTTTTTRLKHTSFLLLKQECSQIHMFYSNLAKTTHLASFFQVISRVPRDFFFMTKLNRVYKLCINRHYCLFPQMHGSVSRTRWFSQRELRRQSWTVEGFFFCPSTSAHTPLLPMFSPRSSRQQRSKAVVEGCHP